MSAIESTSGRKGAMATRQRRPASPPPLVVNDSDLDTEAKSDDTIPLFSSKTYTILVDNEDRRYRRGGTMMVFGEDEAGPGPSHIEGFRPPAVGKKPSAPAKPSGSGAKTEGQGASFVFYIPSETKSNRAIIVQALERCLFSSAVSSPKPAILATMKLLSESKHFLILFRNSEKCPYRALYAYIPVGKVLKKFHGAGPEVIDGDQSMVQYLKYNTAQKMFQVVPTKHLSLTIDGFTIDNSYWTSKVRQLSLATQNMVKSFN